MRKAIITLATVVSVGTLGLVLACLIANEADKASIDYGF